MPIIKSHQFNLTGATMKPEARLLLLLMIFLILPVAGQTNQTLDDYIREGLKNNIVLQQKKISYEKAVYDLNSATSLFFPSIDFSASYVHGTGGRSIDIPVGDLLNPVYQTLNQLTGSNAFPQVQNVKENFFPYKFYDARFRASMPILNTDLIYNRQIEKSKKLISEYEVSLYKKELVKEIKSAYYNYLSSVEAIRIYKSAKELVTEAKRTAESMYKNGAGLYHYVLRTESETESINSQLLDAESKSKSAKKYFNFLLNKDLNADVNINPVTEDISSINPVDESLTIREEIKMLSESVEINKSLLKMNKFFLIPKVSGFFDYGAQDMEWRYNRESRYTLWGVQLDIPIFEGFRNMNKIETAALGLQDAELELKLTENAMSLSLSVAKDELLTAKQNYLSAQAQLKAAESYNNLVEKGYREGVGSFIETVDARNQLTTAKTLVNISKHKVLIANAEYERQNSTIKIDY